MSTMTEIEFRGWDGTTLRGTLHVPQDADRPLPAVEDDYLAPAELTRGFYDQISAPKKVIEMPGGHYDVYWPEGEGLASPPTPRSTGSTSTPEPTTPPGDG